MTLDPGAIGEWLLIALIVGAGVTLGRRREDKKIAKELNQETAALALTRGEMIDDLRDEIIVLEVKLAEYAAIVKYLDKAD